MARIATLVPVIAAVAGAAAAQATLVVPTSFPTIQAAIVAASPGDTVLVLPGTYVERIDFLGKAITVRSANGAAATTIDGNQGGTVVSFVTLEPPTAVLQGFTIRNGLGIAAPAGGIQCTIASPTIRACVVTGNQGRTGAAGAVGGAGGIHATESSLRLFDCEVRNNTGGDGGGSTSGAGGKGGPGGVYVETIVSFAATAPTLERCRIAGNRGGNGGLGVVAGPTFGRGGPGGFELSTYANSTVLRACAFVGNDGGNGGTGNGGAGGFDVYGATAFIQSGLTMQNCIAVGNRGGNGGISAVCFGGDGGGTLTNGIVVFSAVGSTFAGNDGGLPVGPGAVTGGIAVGGWQLSSANLRNCILWGNTRNGAPSDLLISGIAVLANTCDIGASGPVVGTGNLSADPLFVNLAADDVHLTAASPCRHAGSAIAGLPLFDFEGDPRVIGPAIDIGADEYDVLPGSREDLALAVSVNGAFTPAVNPSPAPAGSTVAIAITTPGGTLASAYALLGLEFWVPPNPPVGPVGLPEFHFSPAAAPLVTFAGGIGATGVVLPVAIPGGLAGLAARVQAFALTPTAKNGVFAASAARDVVF